MSEYTQARALADRMLRKKGGVVTLTRTVPNNTYNTATSSVGTPVVTTYSGSGVRTEYDLKEIDGTSVKAGDVRMLISPKTRGGSDFPQPAPTTDVIALGGRNYTVVSVNLLNFNGIEDVLFTVQARGIQ